MKTMELALLLSMNLIADAVLISKFFLMPIFPGSYQINPATSWARSKGLKVCLVSV